MILLDTDVLIDVQRGHPPAVTWFEESSTKNAPSVPGLVVMELVQDARDLRRVGEALSLVAPLPVIWPTESDGQRALDLFVAYRHSHGLGLVDAIIAACALGRSAVLCTFNDKHYRVIPGLSLHRPYLR